MEFKLPNGDLNSFRKKTLKSGQIRMAEVKHKVIERVLVILIGNGPVASNL